MFIQVGKFFLRRPEPKDIDALYDYRNDPNLVSWLGFSRGFSKSDIGDWIERHRKSTEDIVWIIADSTDHCVGHIGLYKINQRNGTADIGICIGSASLWGGGLGERITRSVLHYAFQELNLRRIRAVIMEINVRSGKVLEKCGFTQEGVEREAEYREGRYINMICFGLLKHEWKAGLPA